jgi:hypothetical protein
MQNYLVKTPVRGLRRRVGDPRRPIEDGAVICLHPIEVEGLIANGALEETDHEVTVEVVSQFATIDLAVNGLQATSDYRPTRDQVIAAVVELGGVAIFEGEALTGKQIVLIVDGLNNAMLIDEVVRRVGAGEIIEADFRASPGIDAISPLITPPTPPIDYGDGASLDALEPVEQVATATDTAMADDQGADGTVGSDPPVAESIPAAPAPTRDAVKPARKPKVSAQ